MRKPSALFASLSLVIVLTAGLLWMVLNQDSLAAISTVNHPADGSLAQSAASSSDEADAGSDDEQPPADLEAGIASLDALPTPIPGETLVYFVPTDNDSTGTALSLYNTDTITHIVALRGFSYNGVLVYSLNLTIGPTSFLRLASDSIASAPPPSWATPAPIITNFTDFTYFASLSLPKGVSAEGYTLFNPGTGVVDPRQDQGAIPLSLSPATDSLTVQRVGNGSGEVTSSPSGIDCGATCSEVFFSGTQITLTATADASSTFAGWSGACTGTDCRITLDADDIVTATFALKTFELDVATTGSGGGRVTSSPAGIDCGSTCTACL